MWSPDGKQIAFGSKRGICLVNADGSGVADLEVVDVSSLHANPDRAENGGGLEWASDGRILTSDAASGRGDVSPWTSTGVGSPSSPRARCWGRSRCPRTALKLALHDQGEAPVRGPRPGDAAGQVTILDDTQGYVLDSFTRVSWSPDGAAMAFSSDSMALLAGSGYSGSYLFVVNADGTGLSRVPGLPQVYDPVWQPE